MNKITELLATAGRLNAARDIDDAALLARFAADRDPVAFEVLVWRHGGLVRGVCRRYLADPADIDDATQAAFIALARRAHSVRSVGPWLARVAAHAARRLRQANAVWAARHAPITVDVPASTPAPDDGWRCALAEEIAGLPDHYRAIVRRCYLDGLSASEAAREFGWARGTVLTRLAWAKVRLRQRLTARGVTLGAGGVVGLLFQLAAGPVTRAAARDIVRAMTGAPGARVSQITDGVLTAMFWTKVNFAIGAALVTCTAALVGAAGANTGSAADNQSVVALAPAPRVSQTTPATTRGAATPVKSQTEITPRASNGPVKTKPGVGPGGGAGFGPGAAPAPGEASKPMKTKPGAGPGFGAGTGGGATPIEP
ncbi:sigma-70 family rna polymerase sigma factor : RNA polymerase sigma factor, sigma-70 family OS=Singulisphaera acidiphila (strain ATCC BAA-1392 / DSM 18658 / VKM B-2454 / MOB10) GN=Sinac_6419 PE=4 SV=1: Sigma70_r2: Sigma70_r4_2 [Gemmata massiliana]|uniref:RNA polymerase sigma-70 region 2 domain-containing protein n=1 Tax=Gemmata massiliana TaxID=1210884 RepID=A0A6P2DA40_9BACT|nr:sigma-70 family RNA polymerase sigma factor [Gemmata massiliana]VTR97747.1 sigma-70 family rna polymerase sigma factor : RNA polymerase sigma factor, sigma-70 family OS=Singulisphaera acidiphila (strain ATCC BAA-1392 / DSM 18658 / VKM B-2454 / MOB10) GN=Sinac_6419 PE=4 SV=1: Sigma70_r2: Sigma70_r4_2 [Gemmata massiliana]